jgi:hypothetical protein
MFSDGVLHTPDKDAERPPQELIAAALNPHEIFAIASAETTCDRTKGWLQSFPFRQESNEKGRPP